jgi:hypothetical protein
MTLDQLVGAGADLRATDVAGAEAIAAEKLSGKPSPTLPALGGVQANRAHPDYAGVLQDLQSGTEMVGGPDGGQDRVIIADTLLADTVAGTMSTFVTVDEKVYVRLARKFADPPITWPKPAKGVPEPRMVDKLKSTPEASSGAFTISIRGHKMKVRYM